MYGGVTTVRGTRFAIYREDAGSTPACGTAARYTPWSYKFHGYTLKTTLRLYHQAIPISAVAEMQLAMLRVTEYFAKTLKVIQNDTRLWRIYVKSLLSTL